MPGYTNDDLQIALQNVSIVVALADDLKPPDYFGFVLEHVQRMIDNASTPAMKAAYTSVYESITMLKENN